MKNLDQEGKTNTKNRTVHVIKRLYVRAEIQTCLSGPQIHQFCDAVQLGMEHMFAVNIVICPSPPQLPSVAVNFISLPILMIYPCVVHVK